MLGQQKIKVFTCEVCHAEFFNIMKFMEHKTTLGVFNCTWCDALFHTAEEVGEHADKEHESQEEDLLISDLDTEGQLVNNRLIKSAIRKGDYQDSDMENKHQMEIEDICTTKQPTIVHLFVEALFDQIPYKKRRKEGEEESYPKEDKSSNSSAHAKGEIDNGQYLVHDSNVYQCKHCKRHFSKERHVLSHKCSARGDYIGNLNESSSEEENSVSEEYSEFDPTCSADETDNERTSFNVFGRNEAAESDDFETDVEKKKTCTATRSKLAQVRRKRNTLKGNLAETGSIGEKNTSFMNKENIVLEGLLIGNTEQGKAVPVFSTEEERLEFEKYADGIDLSIVDHLFSKHLDPRNKTFPPGSCFDRRKTKDCHTYICSICKKSTPQKFRIRLHCLIHTDLKPFRCKHCNFCTNTKNNLHSHMRKHTGNFLRCTFCDFKTCYKGQLVEHESEHITGRWECQLCAKDYATLRSLTRHVAKRHTGSDGQQYISSLQKQQTPRMTSLYPCHICNRKFKNRAFRDRHVASHGMDESELIPGSLNCGLCSYTAPKRTALEHHYKRHRLIFVCCVCSKLYQSSSQLKDHLSEHQKDTSTISAQPPTQNQLQETQVSTEKVNSHSEKHMDTESQTNSADLLGAKLTNSANLQGEKNTEQDVSCNPCLDHHNQVSLDSLFGKSIRHSWYRPEPDGHLPSKEYLILSDELLEKQKEDCPGHEAENSNLDGNISKGTPASEYEEKVSNMPPGVSSIILNLYKPLDENVFRKIREAFGEIECPTCGRLFHTKNDLEPHLLTHFKDKPFKCDLCSYTACRKENVKRHYATNHEHKKFHCNQCDFFAYSNGALSAHRRTHIKFDGKCPKCEVKISTWKMLGPHMRVQHPEIDREEMKRLTGSYHHVKGEIGQRSYRCPYCSRIYQSASIIKKHIWIHEGIKPYKCPHCDHRSRRRNHLQLHMLMHSEERPFKCQECDKSYRSKISLMLHMQTTHERTTSFKCDRCDYVGYQKGHLKKHMRLHEKKLISCDKCDYSTYHTTNLNRHVAGHEGKQVYSCDRCDFNTYSRYHMKSHKEFHDGRILYSCDRCEYDASQKSFLKVHKESHEGKMVYTCDKCDYCTTDEIRFKKHQEMHDTTTFYICAKCNYSASHQNYLKIHMKMHETNTEYKCSRCNFSTEDTKEFKKHEADHDGKKLLCCSLCDFATTRSSRLKMHEETHSKDIVYSCDKCTYSTSNKYHFKRHVSGHEGKITYGCFKCDFTAEERTQIKIHMETHNEESQQSADKGGESADGKALSKKVMKSSEVSYKCDKCEFSTAHKIQLKKHMKAHHQRQLACQQCDYTCASLNYLKAHCSARHQDVVFKSNASVLPGESLLSRVSIMDTNTSAPEDKRIFKCLSCAFVYKSGNDLKRHLKSQHDLSLDNVDFNSEDGLQVEILTDAEITPENIAAASGGSQKIQMIQMQETFDNSATVNPHVTQVAEIDEKLVSEVNLIQQIIEQGAIDSPVTYQAVDAEGQLVAVNPETIIVQEDAQNVFVGKDGQYVIQYITQDAQSTIIPETLQITGPG